MRGGGGPIRPPPPPPPFFPIFQQNARTHACLRSRRLFPPSPFPSPFSHHAADVSSIPGSNRPTTLKRLRKRKEGDVRKKEGEGNSFVRRVSLSPFFLPPFLGVRRRRRKRRRRKRSPYLGQHTHGVGSKEEGEREREKGKGERMEPREKRTPSAARKLRIFPLPPPSLPSRSLSFLFLPPASLLSFLPPFFVHQDGTDGQTALEEEEEEGTCSPSPQKSALVLPPPPPPPPLPLSHLSLSRTHLLPFLPWETPPLASPASQILTGGEEEEECMDGRGRKKVWSPPLSLLPLPFSLFLPRSPSSGDKSSRTGDVEESKKCIHPHMSACLQQHHAWREITCVIIIKSQFTRGPCALLKKQVACFFFFPLHLKLQKNHE